MVAGINIPSCVTLTPEEWKKSQEEDKDCKKILERLKKPRSSEKNLKYFCDNNGVLHLNNPNRSL